MLKDRRIIIDKLPTDACDFVLKDRRIIIDKLPTDAWIFDFERADFLKIDNKRLPVLTKQANSTQSVAAESWFLRTELLESRGEPSLGASP